MVIKLFKKILHNYQEHFFSHFEFRKDFDGRFDTPDKVNDAIYSLLTSDKPCMVSRFGSNEMACMMYYIKYHHPFWFLRRIFPFWTSSYLGERMVSYAGFFPRENKLLCDFSDLMTDAAAQVDFLGSWLEMEKKIENHFSYQRGPLYYLEPYWSIRPWSRALAGKKVLVVHPFADTISLQYSIRESLFKNKDVLPEFASLVVIQAVQSLGGDNNEFNTWFDALRFMEEQIDSVEYDVALIGCGAYGMPLAAHCKKMGKKAIHMGGALQLLFGIVGSRWEEPGYGSEYGLDYKELLDNPNWVRPSAEEKPQTANAVENACYW